MQSEPPTCSAKIPTTRRESGRLFCPMKSNLSRLHQPLSYRLAEDEEGGCKLEWLGLVDTTADNAMNGKSASRKELAAQWLISAFRTKLEWDSDDLFKAASEEGISRSAVFEAKKELGLPGARRTVRQNGDIVWVWSAPEDWDKFTNGADEMKL